MGKSECSGGKMSDHGAGRSLDVGHFSGVWVQLKIKIKWRDRPNILEQVRPQIKRMRLITVTKKLAVMEMSRFLSGGCIGCSKSTTTVRTRLETAMVLDFSRLLMHHNYSFTRALGPQPRAYSWLNGYQPREITKLGRVDCSCRWKAFWKFLFGSRP